jgi:hypothetical protein
MALVVLAVLAGPATAYDIDMHRWQDRVLVIAAPGPGIDAVRDLRERVAARSPAVRERRLRVLEIYADSARLDGSPLPAGTHRELQDRLRIAPGDSRLLLIGLDGGIKRATRLDTPLTELFEQIDAMPMRRQEIRERRDAGLPLTPP